MLAVESLFFPFLFFILFSLSSKPVSCNITFTISSTLPHPHTGDIPLVPPQHHNYCTNPVATTTAATSPFVGLPTTCCIHPYPCHGHTQATPLPSPLLCLVHPKKPQISHFPFYFPLSLMVQDISPQHRPVSPPMACKHPPHLPSCKCRLSLPYHHHLYNQHHLTNPIALQLASPNFSTQTGGEKGALALTIPATPTFAHPPPLSMSSHLCG